MLLPGLNMDDKKGPAGIVLKEPCFPGKFQVVWRPGFEPEHNDLVYILPSQSYDPAYEYKVDRINPYDVVNVPVSENQAILMIGLGIKYLENIKSEKYIPPEEWKEVSTIPKEGIVLVWLEEPILESQLHVSARHPKVSTIAGRFEFDCPKILKWMYPPKDPSNEY